MLLSVNFIFNLNINIRPKETNFVKILSTDSDMIQRIQSLYLLLTTLFSVLFLNGSIIEFIDKSNSRFTINLTGINKLIEGAGNEQIEKLLLLSIVFLIVPVLSVITLLLFKKRKLQLGLAIGLIFMIVLQISVIVYYSYFVIRNNNADIVPEIKLLLPVLMLICSWFAYAGIKKDEELIKSYDRLR